MTKKVKNYVAYYRAGGENSLVAIESQKVAIAKFAKDKGGVVLREFQDTQNGKISDRNGLFEAIGFARKHGACLLVTSLDRLGRDFETIEMLSKDKPNPLRYKTLEGSNVGSWVLDIFASIESKLKKRSA